MVSMNRRRLLLGIILCVALGCVAVAFAFKPTDTQLVSTDQRAVAGSEGNVAATTSTTPTTIIVVDGVPFSFPIPPLPPGVTMEPSPDNSVLNIHQRVDSIDPAVLAALNQIINGGTTTTTTRP